MFLGYEIDGVVQQEPPDWLREKMSAVIAEVLHVTFVKQGNEVKAAG